MLPGGSVVSLHIAAAAAASMQTFDWVEAVAARGIAGDRYFSGLGTYSNHPGSGRQVTLIESEAIIALARDYGIELNAGLARRNIVTVGVALNHLVEKTFTIGAVRLRGQRLCEPCRHLEGLTRQGAMRGLIHRGGLRAEIISGGIIRIGDSIMPVES
jgi:MOSC domain-containing protein YiiM